MPIAVLKRKCNQKCIDVNRSYFRLHHDEGTELLPPGHEVENEEDKEDEEENKTKKNMMQMKKKNKKNIHRYDSAWNLMADEKPRIRTVIFDFVMDA